MIQYLKEKQVNVKVYNFLGHPNHTSTNESFCLIPNNNLVSF